MAWSILECARGRPRFIHAPSLPSILPKTGLLDAFRGAHRATVIHLNEIIIPSSLASSLGNGIRSGPTAVVERAHSYRARSASTEDHQAPSPSPLTLFPRLC